MSVHACLLVFCKFNTSITKGMLLCGLVCVCLCGVCVFVWCVCGVCVCGVCAHARAHACAYLCTRYTLVQGGTNARMRAIKSTNVEAG